MKHLLVVLMALVVAGMTGVRGECSSTPVARAVAVEPDFSFGVVAEGKKLTHTFLIENKGDATLTIKKVATG